MENAAAHSYTWRGREYSLFNSRGVAETARKYRAMNCRDRDDF